MLREVRLIENHLYTPLQHTTETRNDTFLKHSEIFGGVKIKSSLINSKFAGSCNNSWALPSLEVALIMRLHIFEHNTTKLPVTKIYINLI